MDKKRSLLFIWSSLISFYGRLKFIYLNIELHSLFKKGQQRRPCGQHSYFPQANHKHSGSTHLKWPQHLQPHLQQCVTDFRQAEKSTPVSITQHCSFLLKVIMCAGLVSGSIDNVSFFHFFKPRVLGKTDLKIRKQK